MATIYLRSTDGNDADDGSTWALAKATLNAALTAAGAGGTVYVSDNHAESQASALTVASPGTADEPVSIICVDDSAEPPTARASTATVTTTGSSAISFTGFAYCYGITFSCGTTGVSPNIGFTGTSPLWWKLDTCILKWAATGPNKRMNIGPVGATTNDDFKVEFVNTSVHFSASTDAIIVRCLFEWKYSVAVVVAGATPTLLFAASSSANGLATLVGVDLSDLGGSSTLVQSGASSTIYRFINCKLGSSVTITSGIGSGQGGNLIELINCDSADTNYRFHRENFEGIETQETTIVRTSPAGASDGTTPFSRKIVSAAEAFSHAPYRTLPLEFWNDTLSSQTVTVQIITDNVTLTDAECWMEIEYLGTSGFPLSLLASDRVSDPIFGTPANQATSTDTWTTTGLTTPVTQALAVTFTPAEKGIVRATVCLGKASTTVYYDPKVNVS